jgi:anti-sigma B factor antagonist
MLSINPSKTQDSLVISLTGRIDANSAKELEQQSFGWIEGGENKLVLDFTAVDFISSAGLRVILLIAKKLEPAGGKVKLCGLNATLRDVFEISGFSKLFVIVPSVAEAL